MHMQVLQRVEFFVRVPEKVRSLKALLESDAAQLKHVYLEAIKLESLRKALIKEIRVARYRRNISPDKVILTCLINSLRSYVEH
jgi:hypothetical protein